MKKVLLSLMVAATIGASAFTVVSPGSPEKKTAPKKSVAVAIQNYKVIPAESKITWIGRKVAGEHNGNITLASGTILLDRTALRGGTFIMDMNSITCNDLQGGSNKRLVDHLKSDDFFSVEKNPTAMFAITNIAPRANAKSGTANYTITGDLTIKGISNQISFPALVTLKKGVATAKANFKFDRTKWDVKFRSGNFFENLGDKAIQDDVELNIELVAKQESVAKK
ncbi:YceI family protein [Rufibacter tibetensis]|uniref:Lipid/polyisoprenoid-binding YceI-like domain-containing protein n=1 Tax=Rufibacter tibetensis TaxID=512763 RepID=A0A0P0CJP5_9BACT|nr:YceI family protein [Rufibacter tibetensis]ALI99670.1 hypothetical protein DC20_12675 [Rufibacter tibetensis]